MSDIQSSYDRLAQTYADHLSGELEHKPFDRQMLLWLLQRVGEGRGPICDLGCGPGQVARFLSDYGARVDGIDFSAAMVEQARSLSPDLPFSQGDMRALTGIADATYGGIAAFYSLIHLTPTEIPAALTELRRVLVPGGTLLVTFHLGSEVRHLDSMWDVPVSIDFHFFERDQMKAWLEGAGFVLEEAIERDPYPAPIEVATRRAYLFARKP